MLVSIGDHQHKQHQRHCYPHEDCHLTTFFHNQQNANVAAVYTAANAKISKIIIRLHFFLLSVSPLHQFKLLPISYMTTTLPCNHHILCHSLILPNLLDTNKLHCFRNKDKHPVCIQLSQIGLVHPAVASSAHLVQFVSPFRPNIAWILNSVQLATHGFFTSPYSFSNAFITVCLASHFNSNFRFFFRPLPCLFSFWFW